MVKYRVYAERQSFDFMTTIQCEKPQNSSALFDGENVIVEIEIL